MTQLKCWMIAKYGSYKKGFWYGQPDDESMFVKRTNKDDGTYVLDVIIPLVLA